MKIKIPKMVLEIVIAIIVVLLIRQILMSALSTDLPMVAVLSDSMSHDDNTPITHYEWLENNIGYEKETIDSWPVHKGIAMGDVPVIKGEKNYHVGDVVIYTISGDKVPIIHRIIKINDDDTFQTKGDHNIAQLPYEVSIAKNQIHGKVLFVIPKIGIIRVLVSRIFGV